MLDLQQLFTEGVEDQLRCFVCNKYLSYFPISLCSNNRSICGRCIVPEGLICFQNEALETICRFSKFPCCYQSEGCCKELLPEHIPEHENTCLYKIIPCITDKPVACKWKGCLQSLLQHCHNQHSDLILKSGEFLINSSVSEQCENLIEYDKKLFIVRRKFDSENKYIQCTVHYNPYETKIESLPLQLIARNGQKTTLVDFKETELPEIARTIQLSLQHILEKDDSNEIILAAIYVGNTRVMNKNYPEKGKINDSEMLAFLKCSYCAKFAVPPIFRCIKNGSRLCDSCRLKHSGICNKTLPFCDPSEYKVFNKIADLLQYPCRYQNNGCVCISHCQHIRRHEEFCKYADEVCPFKIYKSCKWNGIRKDLDQHILSYHQDIISNSSEDIFQLDTTKCTSPTHRVLTFSNRLFRLSYFKGEDDTFKWSVQTITLCQQPYMYEIKFIDKYNEGNLLIMKQHCCRMTQESQIFTTLNYFKLYNEQLRHVGSYRGRTVDFKVHIST